MKFFIITQCRKIPKGFSTKLETFFVLHWKHQKKTNLLLRKLFGEKSHNAEKPKKRPFRRIKRFLQTDNFKKIPGVPFDRIQKFSEKVA